mmetsp:Transcript_5128/g.16517  ORF Transcript_5128/g.16517 Transcript_5128/m.16517 type:complete len:391 (-) Transcript_5128:423-1595(-)
MVRSAYQIGPSYIGTTERWPRVVVGVARTAHLNAHVSGVSKSTFRRTSTTTLTQQQPPLSPASQARMTVRPPTSLCPPSRLPFSNTLPRLASLSANVRVNVASSVPVQVTCSPSTSGDCQRRCTARPSLPPGLPLPCSFPPRCQAGRLSSSRSTSTSRTGSPGFLAQSSSPPRRAVTSRAKVPTTRCCARLTCSFHELAGTTTSGAHGLRPLSPSLARAPRFSCRTHRRAACGRTEASRPSCGPWPLARHGLTQQPANRYHPPATLLLQARQHLPSLPCPRTPPLLPALQSLRRRRAPHSTLPRGRRHCHPCSCTTFPFASWHRLTRASSPTACTRTWAPGAFQFSSATETFSPLLRSSTGQPSRFVWLTGMHRTCSRSSVAFDPCSYMC